MDSNAVPLRHPEVSQSSKALPEVSFLVNYSGITVLTHRLNTPRFVPFDRVKGRCGECKSNMLDIDYAVQNEGITIITSRMKQPKFVRFDLIEPLPNGTCFFRVKFQGKTFNVPYTQQRVAEAAVIEPSGQEGNQPQNTPSSDDPTDATSQVEQMTAN